MTSALEYWSLASEVELLYTNYCEALDDEDIDRWPSFFTNDCSYRVTTRENMEREMPLSFVICEGIAMVRDRAEGVKDAVFYRRRFQRRIVSGLRLKTLEGIDGGAIETVASFVVYESIGDGQSQLLVCGRSRDVVVREGDNLRFRQRLCVIDAALMPDSLVFPI